MFVALLLVACTDEPGVGADIVPTPEQSGEIDTVLTVTWTTEEPGVSWIEFGDDEAYGYVTARTAAATEHRVLLAGLPVASTTHWRAVTEVDGEPLFSADQVVQTRPAPSSAPELTVSFGASESTDFIATTAVAEHTWAFVFDRQGRLVWYDDADYQGFIFTEATLSRDGTALLLAAYPKDRSDETSYIRRVSLDQSVRELIPMPLGHHDFVELPEGGYAWLTIEVRDIAGEPAVGDVIVEADSAGNVIREVWNAWEQIVVPDEVGEDDDFYPQGWDWVHGNSLNYDEASDQYVYSAHAISTVYVIDRASGETAWSVGDQGEFTLTDGTAFQTQHQAKLLESGNLLLFDNTLTESTSAAREYAIDVDAKTWAEVWTYETQPGQWAYLLGDANRRDDGTTVVTTGTVGFICEADEAGEQTWRVDVAIGNVLGFTQVLKHLGGVW